MLVGFQSEISLKRFKRVLVITSIISESHENTAILWMWLELEDAEFVSLYCLEALMQAF